ncbi:MAG: DUF6714 family protein [bacterium]
MNRNKAMNPIDPIIHQIHEAFGGNPYPGDPFLQGSFEGCEPFEAIAPFKGRMDWRTLEAKMLDENYTALSFFSEAGLRFFLPAFLLADLREELQTADPLFTLTHGFYDFAIQHERKGRVFTIRSGRTVLLNPRRYGAMTHFDYARYRLSIFTRDEARAIVAYLEYKRDADPYHIAEDAINGALALFWRDRAEHAPTAEDLRRHLTREEVYFNTIKSEAGEDE